MKSILIIYKYHFNLGIVENKLEFVYIDGGIDGCKQGTDLLNCQIQHDPFRAVFGKDRDFISSFHGHIIGSDTEGQQTGTELVHGVGHFCSTVFFPLARRFSGQHIRQGLSVEMVLQTVE